MRYGIIVDADVSIQHIGVVVEISDEPNDDDTDYYIIPNGFPCDGYRKDGVKLIDKETYDIIKVRNQYFVFGERNAEGKKCGATLEEFLYEAHGEIHIKKINGNPLTFSVQNYGGVGIGDDRYFTEQEYSVTENLLTII